VSEIIVPSAGSAAGAGAAGAGSGSSAGAGASAVAVPGFSLPETVQLAETCKAQYAQCMDNFCNVLNDNQGRCSCSPNLKNYAKTEEAVKKATEDLQDVAQKIQYIGLTKEEIVTLFSATEAELTMSGTTDSTRIKSDLDRVKNLIIDVKSGTATASDSGMSLDLSGLLSGFELGGNGFDLSALFSNAASTGSIANQRGAELYKTASARCKTAVLSGCQTNGADASVISNSYDLEIDKHCLMYEKSLADANTSMSSTVRNAKSVLQKARLLVAQQKNSYDLRGCVNALDSCMQDEFVCGSDYENCLDPSGKYVVNGAVVVGSTPGISGGKEESGADKFAAGLYEVWNYKDKSAWLSSGSVNEFIDEKIEGGKATDTSNMVGYLQEKIGYVDSGGKKLGLCVSVLTKCQKYTFSADGSVYKGDNSVTRSYLERTLKQIKTSQDGLLTSYAGGCIGDVASCFASNNYEATPETAEKACGAQIATCASVVGSSVSDIIGQASSNPSTITYVMVGDVKFNPNFNIPKTYDVTATTVATATAMPNNRNMVLAPYNEVDLHNLSVYQINWYSNSTCSGSPITHIPVGSRGPKTVYMHITHLLTCPVNTLRPAAGTTCDRRCTAISIVTQ
jgi:hypothetical protein